MATKIQKDIRDPHSFADPEMAVVSHLDLELTVDFDKRILWGSAEYALKLAPGAREIVFDTRDLEIESVQTQGQDLLFSLGEEKPFLGRPLRVEVHPGMERIRIRYATRPGAAALQWLRPEQTAGKQHPFLFTQSQAILARTWIPCQDSPSIRFTYTASLQVPPQYLALMSAENPREKNASGHYIFRMRQPIPSYLMALAVGELAFEAFDDRSGIYAEPVMLQQGYQEFLTLPRMIGAAENLYGPYLWERYDLLLLPPSFPFGGMENPRLTFVTPTILAGDRSLTSLIAHELAHSWSGNLVTNATWNDFWLNEGFTVYFERRIMEALEGKAYADMLKVLGYQDLQQTLKDLGADTPDTHLRLHLEGRDPDDGLTEIAYEKGNYLLLSLEARFGREVFDAFIRRYFQEFAFQAMDTETFLRYLQQHLLLPNLKPGETFPVEEWIYQPGLPADRPELKAEVFDQVDTQVAAWRQGKNPGQLHTSQWTTQEWLYFLNQVSSWLGTAEMEELDQAFQLTEKGNAEIKAAWLLQAIRHHYLPAFPALEEFLLQVGRRKFLEPLYKALLH
ncbi:MAG: M1 family metallopeptidase, partial [Adhaeribacter sp.]